MRRRLEPIDHPTMWPDRPLTGPEALCDFFDLVATRPYRRAGTFYLVYCDRYGFVVRPCAVGNLDNGPHEDHERIAAAFAQTVREHFPGETIAAGVARPGPAEITPRDRAWRAVIESAVLAEGVRFLGFACATLEGVLAVPPLTAPARPAPAERCARPA